MSNSGKASTTKTTFSRSTSVNIHIQAEPDIVWALLTNATDMARWNATVVSVEGTIAPGETIRLVSTLDSDRTFKLKITTFEPPHQLIWADGMAPFFRGVRTYTITPQPNGATQFTMHEKIGGLMFPMAAKHIPDFDASFEQYAADLKQEAEKIATEK